MKTSSSILLRTSLVFAVAARTTGMKTPSTSVVISTVATAARLGAALRRNARSASRRKKNELHRSASQVHAGRLVAHHAALVQLDHAAAHPVHHLVVVGGDDHRRPGAVHAVQQLHDPDRGLGVEVAGRLVRQQQRRVVDERARQRHALLLAAGQLVGVAVELRRQADQPQDLRHLRLDARSATPRSPSACRRRCRRRCGSAAACSPGTRRRCCGAAWGSSCAAAAVMSRPGDQHLAAGGVHLAQQQLDEGGLAAAGLPDEEGELPAPDRRGGPVEADVAAGIDDGHVPQLHRGRARGAVQERPAGVQSLVNSRHEQGILTGEPKKPAIGVRRAGTCRVAGPAAAVQPMFA